MTDEEVAKWMRARKYGAREMFDLGWTTGWSGGVVTRLNQRNEHGNVAVEMRLLGKRRKVKWSLMAAGWVRDSLVGW